MAPTLKIGQNDLSPFILWGDRAHDFGQPRMAQFGGNIAFSDGQPWVRDSSSNKEWGLPLLLQARSSALVNLCTNPRAGAGATTDWTNVADTLEAVSFGGSNPAAPTATLQTGFHVVDSAGTGAGRYDFSATNGTAYTVSGWIYVVSGTVLLRIFDAGGTSKGSTTVSGTGWVYTTLTVTADATATWSVRVFNTTAPAEYYYTGILLETGSTPHEYFDGDSLDANWSGTANASTSVALTGTDGLHQMVQDLNGAVGPGQQVAFKPQGATNTSYFDLERGILEPHWDLYEDTAGVLRATLRLYTRPYATTGTTRLVASVVGSGVVQTTASGITGDMLARGVVKIGFPSGYSATSFFAFGTKEAAASYFQPHKIPASLTSIVGGVVGASGALGSQAIVGTQVEAQDAIGATAVGAYTGRYRVFLLARQAVSPASAVTYSLAWSSKNTATFGVVQATVVSASQWGVYDMGEMTIIPSVLTQAPWVIGRATTGASYLLGASSLQLAGWVMLPLDSVGVSVDDFPLGGAKETLSFISYPDTQAVRMLNASAITGRSNAYQAGPEFAPTATAGTRVVALAGRLADYNVGQQVNLSVEVRERFSYLR